jgi:hypothetical protein
MEKDKQNKEICRAMIEPSDNEAFDFTATIIPTENKQLRYSWENNEYFYQVLRTGKDNIKIDRMESGLPLFDNHPEFEDAGALNQLGITVGYEFTELGITAPIKFGARADEALRSDVKNKIVKTVSIEGNVLVYSVVRNTGELPIYYADLWEPDSIHFAPVPNDIAAQIEVKRAIQKQIEIPKADKSIIKSLTTKF